MGAMGLIKMNCLFFAIREPWWNQNETVYLAQHGTTTSSLSLLYKDTVSIKTIQHDDKMINKYREVCGMIIGKGNLSTWRRPTPVPLCQLQIPHDLGPNLGPKGQWPTVWMMAWPNYYLQILAMKRKPMASKETKYVVAKIAMKTNNRTSKLFWVSDIIWRLFIKYH